MEITENQPFTISYDISTSPWFAKQPNGILDITFAKKSGEIMETRNNISYTIENNLFYTTNIAPSIASINDPNNEMFITLYYNNFEIEWFDANLIN